MKHSEIDFWRAAEVVALHQLLIAEFGGADGILNESSLESAVGAPAATMFGEPLYRSIAEIATAYCYGLAKAHAFRDGNKRVALAVAAGFLERNGWHVELSQATWEPLMLRVAGEEGFDRTQLTHAFVLVMHGDEPVIR